jgi:hypothetical protein
MDAHHIKHRTTHLHADTYRISLWQSFFWHGWPKGNWADIRDVGNILWDGGRNSVHYGHDMCGDTQGPWVPWTALTIAELDELWSVVREDRDRMWATMAERADA